MAAGPDAARSRLEAAELAEVNTTTGGGLRRYSYGPTRAWNLQFRTMMKGTKEKACWRGCRLGRYIHGSTERPATSHLDALVLEFQPVHLEF